MRRYRNDRDVADPRLVWLACVLAAIVLVVSVVRSPAAWKPEYANSSPETRQWYRDAQLTDEAKKRFQFTHCCDHADVVRTEFKVNKTTNGDEWWYLTAGGEWKQVPPDIIHVDKHAPDNQPTLFIYNGHETCFFPGGSGI